DDWTVSWSDEARAEVAWLAETHAIELATPIERALALGPEPHPYRRIRRNGTAMVLAVKDWRVTFEVTDLHAKSLRVLAIRTGYRARELATSAAPEVLPHRAFVARFLAAMALAWLVVASSPRDARAQTAPASPPQGPAAP